MPDCQPELVFLDAAVLPDFTHPTAVDVDDQELGGKGRSGWRGS